MRRRSPSVSSSATRAAARRHRREVARHQPREHVLGDAGQRRAARAGLARRLARAGVRERAARRRDEHARGGERGGDGGRRLLRRRPRAAPSRTAPARRPRARRPRAAPRRAPAVVRSTTITTSSPGRTPRHGPTTVSTARCRSLMRPDDSSSHARQLRPRRPRAGVRAPRHRPARSTPCRSSTRPPATVLVVTCNHCPYVIALEPAAARGRRGVRAARRALPRHPRQRRERATRRTRSSTCSRFVREQDWPYPYLHDESQDVARALGAEVTPHVFVLDGEQRLAYRGAPDGDHRRPVAGRGVAARRARRRARRPPGRAGGDAGARLRREVARLTTCGAARRPVRFPTSAADTRAFTRPVA